MQVLPCLQSSCSAQQVARPRSRCEFEVAIICALQLERDAVEALLDEEYETDGHSYGKASGDHNTYTMGRMGAHHIVLAYLPGMGKANCAAVASNMRTSFEAIKIALLVGVCGGAPQTADGTDISLGDVIISQNVIHADFGRQYDHRFVRKDTLEDNLGRADPEIRAFLGKVSGYLVRSRLKSKVASYTAALCDKDGFQSYAYPGSDVGKPFLASYQHGKSTCRAPTMHRKRCGKTEDACNSVLINSSLPSPLSPSSPSWSGDKLGSDNESLIHRNTSQNDGTVLTRGQTIPQRHPSIHFGRIASSDSVMRSCQHRDDIIARENVIAFEMEAAGLWDLLPTVIIKSVCDYADSHKNKTWQKYAAATAAACTKATLEEWRRTEISLKRASSPGTAVPTSKRLRTTRSNDAGREEPEEEEAKLERKGGFYQISRLRIHDQAQVTFGDVHNHRKSEARADKK
ncbi:Nucleoside phosphorylase domain protein [Moelleriella libera RCEF 2490]|uniref:Nucleoside phosphorylase domain protein n=1 Tax=Moelleriella libera RCEF 2490 TaxID=1081109 RepID=A0A168F7G8_9HYPO|nr:Nucleoside phosphorylase domain protein [Moelleriella libera RCEF 2490]